MNEVSDSKPSVREAADVAGQFSNQAAGRATAAALIMAGAVFCALSVATEHGFYYWDFAAYHNETLTAADSLKRFVAHGGDLAVPLFTVPLVPWILLLGDSRLVYILAVYFTFFVPYVVVGVAIAKRIWPDRSGRVASVAAAAILATPACWNHVLQGYPDIAGAALIAACVLLYGRYRPGRGILVPLKIGVLAGLSVILRRHYVYALLALYAGMFLDGLASALTSHDAGPARFPLFRHVLAMAISGAGAVGLIALVNRQFFVMALNTRGEMVAFEQGVAGTLVSIVATVGAIPLALGAFGWVWMWRKAERTPPEVRLIVLATMAWLVIWAVHARQQPYHYPHWLPLFVALGLVSLLLNLARLKSTWMLTAIRATAVALVATGWVLCMPLIATGLPSTTPLRIFPDRTLRSSNPAYVAILDLIQYLRMVTSGEDAILVAASSSVLNFDILRSAESAIYGRENTRLRVLASPQVDSEAFPTDLFLRAQIVVVAEPFQHSLAPEYQKVVGVLVEAFRARWPITEDFEPLPRTFPLPEPGGRVRVYQRRRASSPDVAVDTSHRIDTFVLGHTLGESIWLARSDYPSMVQRNPDGTFLVTTHPARASAQRPTRVALAGASPKTGEISAKVWFYDSRCEGIQIVARVGDGDRPEEVLIGTFSPRANGAPLRGGFPDLRGRAIALEIRSAPAHPEEIDFCTVVLKDLKVASP